MMLLWTFFATLVATAVAYVEVTTPKDAPAYTVRNVMFYYLEGNYSVSDPQKSGVFQIQEMHLNRDVWVILYTKTYDQKKKQDCRDNLRNIPQDKILKIYNNHTVLDSQDTAEEWNIGTGTTLCFQVLHMASAGEWGYFKYKYEDTCRKQVVVEKSSLAPWRSKSLVVRSYKRCYPLKDGFSTVVDFQMTLKNKTSLDRVLVTWKEMKCYYDRYYYYRRRCSYVRTVFQMVTGQTPPDFLADQWPFVLNSTSDAVCFEFDAVGDQVFRDDMVFRISEFPECNGTVPKNYNGTVTNRTGIITSRGYPLYPHGNNTNCTWTIVVEPGERIMVEFGDTKSDCKNDFLKLTGVEGGSQNVELLCGDLVTGTNFISQKNKLNVQFKTSHYRNLKGFLMKYKVHGCSLKRLKLPDNSTMLNPPKDNIPPGFILRVGCQPGYVFASRVAEVKLQCQSDSTWAGAIPFCIGYTVCNVTLIEPEGFVTSPGYPNTYPKNAYCTWTLKAKRGQHIHIQVEDVKSSCNNDYLVLDRTKKRSPPVTTSATQVTPAATSTTTTTATTTTPTNRASTKGYLCGKEIQKGAEYHSIENTAVITFRSNIFQDTGYFKLSYKVVGCSTDDLKKPPHSVLRNRDIFYPVNFELIITCIDGYGFPGGKSSLFLKCGSDRTWIGDIPFCVRKKTEF